MIIRKANINDIEAIAKHNIMLAKESENLDITYEEALNGVRGVLTDSAKGFYLVAEENGDTVGELMITYEWSDWRGKNMWWIQSAYVKKLWRKRGIFKKLVETVKKLAKEKNIDIVRLYVHNHNKKAMKAYEKLGMERRYSVYELSLIHI